MADVAKRLAVALDVCLAVGMLVGAVLIVLHLFSTPRILELLVQFLSRERQWI